MPEVLWAYRTTYKTTTGQTPNKLAFGIEVVIPAELIWLTTRIKNFDVKDNEKAMWLEQENLNKIRETICMREEKYKRNIKKYYNFKVKEKNLAEGDLVLKNAQLTNKKQYKGKLAPNWEGPYVISKVIKEGTFTLMECSDKILSRTWHAYTLKKFYQKNKVVLAKCYK